MILLYMRQTVDLTGGYTFCGVAALALLDRPRRLDGEHSAVPVQRDITNNEELLRFLALRQFGYLSTEESEDDAETENYIEKQLGDLSLEETVCHVGFNGRWNKKADTCYAWWTGGSLSVCYESPSMCKCADSLDYRQAAGSQRGSVTEIPARSYPAHHWRLLKKRRRAPRY